MQTNRMMVVSLDGISGTGKSQIMRTLMGYYQSTTSIKIMGFSENLISPGRLVLADEIDALRSSDLPVEEKKAREDLLFTEVAVEDRAYISRTFFPFARQAGTQILFLDRWFPTNMAYQSLNRLTPETILNLHRDKEVYEPDLYIILTCPVEIAVERVDKRTTKKVRGASGKMSTVRTEQGLVDMTASKKKIRIQKRFLEIIKLFGGKSFSINTYDNLPNILATIISRLDYMVHDMKRPTPISHIEERIWDLFTGEGKPLPEYPFDHLIISG